MQAWQWAVVAGVALVCVGFMSLTIVRMFSGTKDDRGVQREANEVESGIYGAAAPAGTRVFDTYSYRVPARFAGRLRVLVSEDTVVVAGARAPKPIYQTWIWLQGLLLALVPVALAWALVRLDWRPLLLGLGIFVLSAIVMAVGAGTLPALGEPQGMTSGRQTAVEFPLEAVADVEMGDAWSRDGIGLVILPYRAGVNMVAGEHAVSFHAPDGHGRTVSYALHLADTKAAAELAGLLRGER